MLEKLKNILKISGGRNLKEGDITYEELKEKVKKGTILIDVRSIQEYNEGHINGAIQISDYELPLKAKEIFPDKTMEIVVYCQNGGRSRKVYDKLKEQGYKNIYSLFGGIENI